MHIKALPSMGQRLFCCFCFVESAVCSTFAERIKLPPGGALVSSAPTEQKCTNRAEVHQQSYITTHLLRWCT